MESNCPESEPTNLVLTDVPSPGELEIARLQLQQALDTYRTQMTLLVQISTVALIADCTVIGYSLANKTPIVLVAASIFPLLIRYSFETIGRLSIPVLYSAISIEQRYGARGADGLITTFLSFTNSSEYVRKLRIIAGESNSGCFEDRMAHLRSLHRPRLSGRYHLVSGLLPVLALGQIGIGLLLHFALGWPMLGSR